MNKKLIWGVIALICAGLISYYAYRYFFKEESRPEPPVSARTAPGNRNRTLNVNAIVIKEQRLTQDYRDIGRLYPDEEVDLTFQTSGMITNINFTEGTYVKEGQLLAKVNDAPLQAQLQRLEAQVKLAEDRVYRQSALLEKDAVSKEAYEQVKTDLAILQADIDLVKANIALTELRAPFDGRIGLRQISEGAFASVSTVLAKLTKISPIKIEFSVNEQYANTIGVGTEISFTVDNNQNTFYGTVYAKESEIDRTTATLTIRAIYPNSNGVLVPGSTAYINIRVFDIPDAIAVPTEALKPEMGVDQVFLYKSGKAQPVTVTKGIRTESQVQIIDGLHVGDTLITSGILQLRTGLDVTLDNIN